jgi:signal transduction histidine kinase
MSGFRARQRGIRFEEEIGAVPTVEGDGIYLTMAVMNLLLNAYDAAGRGGHVRLAVRTAGGDAGTVEILVEDDGCGIRPEDLGKIFEPFYTTKSESGGSGLGLTIARRIVEEHGGTIRVTSAPGTGSTFAIAIPAARKLAAVGAAGGA